MNKLVVDVEPLSDQRWAKIERNLIARLELASQDPDWMSRQPSGDVAGVGLRPVSWSRVSWLIGAAAAVVLAVLVVSKPAVEPLAVDQPSHVTTGEHASHLAFPGLTLDIKPRSAVVVGAETSAGQLVVLDRGEIVFGVGKRASSAPLIVQAGGTRVRVVGTRFSVVRAGDAGEDVRVEVYEGVVQVESGGHAVRLSAGERWPAQSAAVAPNELGEPSEPVEPDVDSAAAAEKTAEKPAQKAAAAKPTQRPRHAKARAASSDNLDSRAGSDTALESDPEPRLDEHEPEPEPVVRSRQSVFEEATQLERKDPRRASELFRSLETGRDSWAQLALYARGRLEASRGNRELGRRLLQRYLERFPGGSNAEDARAVLQRMR
jgi:hypothetical protein